MMTDIENQLNKDGKLLWMTTGVSMQPMLTERTEQIVIEKLNGRPKLFDVVLYKRKSGAYVLHRIVRKNSAGYVIQGDNCAYVEQVPIERILGVLVGFYRDDKYIDCRKNIKYRIYSVLWIPGQTLLRFMRRVYSKIKRTLFK